VPGVAGSTPDALWSSRAIGLLQPLAVRCSGLRKSVQGRRLLDGVTLELGVGSRLLLIGEPDDAAGLLLRVLAGLARADGGTLELAGEHEPGDARHVWRRRVAYAGPRTAPYDWLSAREVLDLAGRLIGLERGERAERIERAVLHWRLVRDLDVPLRRAGPSVAQRAGLAAALLGDPEVVLLEEPLRSVEPEERTALLKLPGARRTMIVASRYPASEAGIVDRVALLRDGRVALHEPISRLRRRQLPLSRQGVDALLAAIGPTLQAERIDHERATA
jgi:ABC-2 type transport system ATP-binding protein